MSAQPTQAELILTVLSGPDKGASYKVVATKVTLGRSTDNSIVINDPRCSRHHAVIELKPEGIFIEDLSNQNGIDIDGQKSKKSSLKSGSMISLGSTVIRFEIRTQNTAIPAKINTIPTQMQGSSLSQSSVGHAPMNQNSMSHPSLSHPSLGSVPTSSSSRSRNGGKKNVYIIFGVVLIGLIYLLSSESSKKREPSAIRNDAAIEEDIRASEERKDALIKAQQQKGVGTAEYNEVQALYLQGFRDYREGNYVRALEAFEATLALNPKHELAIKYRELAKRRFDETIELTMIEGKRFMEQGKYAQAKASFAQVLHLLKDPKNKKYAEAYSLYNESLILLKGAY